MGRGLNLRPIFYIASSLSVDGFGDGFALVEIEEIICAHAVAGMVHDCVFLGMII